MRRGTSDQRRLPGGGGTCLDLRGGRSRLWPSGTAYLEDADEGLREVVEVAAPHLCVLKVVPTPEELHAQQGTDDDEEEEQQQQGSDGTDGVEQGRHQVAQRRPVPAGGGRPPPGFLRLGGCREGGWGCGTQGKGLPGSQGVPSFLRHSSDFCHFILFSRMRAV